VKKLTQRSSLTVVITDYQKTIVLPPQNIKETNVMVKAKTHPNRGILERDLIPLDTSRKEANSTHRPVSSIETNGRPRVMAI